MSVLISNETVDLQYNPSECMHTDAGSILSTHDSESQSSDEQKSIYIMLSQTQTKFGILIRKVGHTSFNHAAISLDPDLNNLYAFARPQHNALMLAHLVRENVYRYTLGKATSVHVAIFKIDVSKQQYDWIASTINDVLYDDSYMYNLYSVLTYPILKGFSTYKAFSCIEFVMFILQGIGYKFAYPLYRYKPDDLRKILSDNEIFDGNLLTYKPDVTTDESYFAPFNRNLFKKSVTAFRKITLRTLFKKYHK